MTTPTTVKLKENTMNITTAGTVKSIKRKKIAQSSSQKLAESRAKIEEVLNQLTLTALRDGLPPVIQQLFRMKMSAARRALQRHAHPTDVAKPLLDLEELVSAHGLQVGGHMNHQLRAITSFLSKASKEDFESRTKEAVTVFPNGKDLKGLEMKKMLDQARGVLNQLSALNELKIALKNCVEIIFKSVGYSSETKSTTSGQESDVDKWEGERLRGGVLDHLMRVCQRPTIPSDLQQIMLRKVASARKMFLLKASPLNISKPLHDLIDVLNDQGLESSEVVQSHLKALQEMSESKNVNENFSSIELNERGLNGLETRKLLDQAKSYLTSLSELNDLKMIIKKSADLILKDSAYTVEELSFLHSDMDKKSQIDQLGIIAHKVKRAQLPANTKTAVRITLGNAKSIMASPAGQVALQPALTALDNALDARDPARIAIAFTSLVSKISSYDTNKRKRRKRNQLHPAH